MLETWNPKKPIEVVPFPFEAFLLGEAAMSFGGYVFIRMY